MQITASKGFGSTLDAAFNKIAAQKIFSEIIAKADSKSTFENTVPQVWLAVKASNNAVTESEVEQVLVSLASKGIIVNDPKGMANFIVQTAGPIDWAKNQWKGFQDGLGAVSKPFFDARKQTIDTEEKKQQAQQANTLIQQLLPLLPPEQQKALTPIQQGLAAAMQGTSAATPAADPAKVEQAKAVVQQDEAKGVVDPKTLEAHLKQMYPDWSPKLIQDIVAGKAKQHNRNQNPNPNALKDKIFPPGQAAAAPATPAAQQPIDARLPANHPRNLPEQTAPVAAPGALKYPSLGPNHPANQAGSKKNIKTSKKA